MKTSAASLAALALVAGAALTGCQATTDVATPTGQPADPSVTGTPAQPTETATPTAATSAPTSEATAVTVTPVATATPVPSATTSETLPGESPMPSVSAAPTATVPSTRVEAGWLKGTGYRLQVPSGWEERELLPEMDANLFRIGSADVMWVDLPTQVTTTDPKAFRDAFAGKPLPDLTVGGERAYGTEYVQEGQQRRIYAFTHAGRLHVLGMASKGSLAPLDAAWKQVVISFEWVG